MHKLLGAVALSLVLAWTSLVQAGGYDTPMLYTARSIGMGGTAISSVNDGSALFHNPAGLGQTQSANLMVNVTGLYGQLHAAPDQKQTSSIDSDPIVGPPFLLGGSYRITDWLTAGMALFPAASGSARYEYEAGTNNALKEDSTAIVFLEASPGLAVNLDDYNLRIGVGYRLTYTSLKRVKGNVDSENKAIDFEMKGLNFASFRAGLQWAPLDNLELGVAYRSRMTALIESEQAQAIVPYDDASTEMVLPSKLGAGATLILDALRLSVDAEYGFNSENVASVIKGTNPSSGEPESVDNIFKWKDSLTLRGGVEYSLLEGQLPLRTGFIYDAQTSVPEYPTGFGTPPGPTYTGTLGAGWVASWGTLGFALAHRMGSADVLVHEKDEDGAFSRDVVGGLVPIPENEECQFCGGSGEYAITLSGVYFDYTYDWK